MLPDLIPHADAAANSAATAVLLHAMTDDPAYLMDGTVDRLHQSYRAPGHAGIGAAGRRTPVGRHPRGHLRGRRRRCWPSWTGRWTCTPGNRAGFVADELAVDQLGAQVTGGRADRAADGR